jgi:hypothetical protein
MCNIWNHRHPGFIPPLIVLSPHLLENTSKCCCVEMCSQMLFESYTERPQHTLHTLANFPMFSKMRRRKIQIVRILPEARGYDVLSDELCASHVLLNAARAPISVQILEIFCGDRPPGSSSIVHETLSGCSSDTMECIHSKAEADAR